MGTVGKVAGILKANIKSVSNVDESTIEYVIYTLWDSGGGAPTTLTTPTNLSGTFINGRPPYVSLDWDDPISIDDAYVGSWNIERKTSVFGSWSTIATPTHTTGASDSNYDDYTISTGLVYFYRITAISNGTPNDSATSGEVQVNT